MASVVVLHRLMQTFHCQILAYGAASTQDVSLASLNRQQTLMIRVWCVGVSAISHWGSQSHECVEKLKRNMREEHVLKLDWISTLFKHVSLSAACVHKPSKQMRHSHKFSVAPLCLSCDIAAFAACYIFRVLVAG